MSVEVVDDCVLDEHVHKRLLQDLPAVSEIANVPISMIRRSAKPYVSKKVLDWIRNYPAHKAAGESLLLCGVQSIAPSTAPDTIMMAIGGALIRNFTDARVISLAALIKAAGSKTEEVPNPTVLLCPNLFAMTEGKALPDWQVQAVYDVLLQRRVADRLSVVYVEDMNGLRKAYGDLFAKHLTSNYLAV